MKTENIPFPVKWNKNWFRAKCIFGNSWLNLLYFRWHQTIKNKSKIIFLMDFSFIKLFYYTTVGAREALTMSVYIVTQEILSTVI